MKLLKRFFCTFMVAMALSALEVEGKGQIYRREPIVLTEPPDPFYPPRTITWKPRHRYARTPSL